MKDRLRRLTLGSEQFAWTARIRHVRSGEDWQRCIRLRVWRTSARGRTLQVNLAPKQYSLKRTMRWETDQGTTTANQHNPDNSSTAGRDVPLAPDRNQA